jgi:hypothetical protein
MPKPVLAVSAVFPGNYLPSINSSSQYSSVSSDAAREEQPKLLADLRFQRVRTSHRFYVQS